MERRKLGKTAIDVSVIAFGAWQIGGKPFWESKGEAASIEAIHAALDGGINLFDTAPAYGFGTSERLIGKTLKGQRDKLVIATKCGLRWKKEVQDSIYKDLKPESIRFEVEQSLKRLSTDYIDIYQIHWPSPDDPLEPALEAMARLIEEGKIRAIGVSNFDADLLRRAMEVTRIEAIQPKYNILEREAEGGLLPLCRENDISVLVYSPLASGLLTGKYPPGTKFTDWRGGGNFGIFREETIGEAYEQVERLKTLASKWGMPLAHMAINWLLAKPYITSALVGVKEARHVTENLACLKSPLTKEEEAEIDEISA